MKKIIYDTKTTSRETTQQMKVSEALQNCDNQINVRLNDEDFSDFQEINEHFFENAISNSTLGRILIRKGIQSYKKLKE